MITAFVYGMAEQYSPHGRKIVDKALELKAKHDASAAKKNSDKKKAKKLKMKKRVAQRADGRFVYLSCFLRGCERCRGEIRI